MRTRMMPGRTRPGPGRAGQGKGGQAQLGSRAAVEGGQSRQTTTRRGQGQGQAATPVDGRCPDESPTAYPYSRCRGCGGPKLSRRSSRPPALNPARHLSLVDLRTNRNTSSPFDVQASRHGSSRAESPPSVSTNARPSDRVGRESRARERKATARSVACPSREVP